MSVGVCWGALVTIITVRGVTNWERDVKIVISTFCDYNHL